MAYAHLQKWSDAQKSLEAGHRACPRDERFDVELAGTAFRQKHLQQSATWLHRALKLNPDDRYTLDFSGTVYYLMGNVPAALKYWNRVDKPFVSSIEFDPNLRTHRLLLDRAFVFSPQQVVDLRRYEATQARLNALGIFSTYSISLTETKNGRFDATLHGMERNGFGPGRVPALISVLSGLPYETIYPSYWNIGRRAMNLGTLLRWDSEKRRAWADLSAPVQELPQWRWAASLDAREENWNVRRWYGSAPTLASLHLRKAAAGAAFANVHSGSLQWRLGGELSDRRFSKIANTGSLTPKLTTSGVEVAFLGSFNATPLRIPEHRFTLSTSAGTRLARVWAKSAHLFESLNGAATAEWLPGSDAGQWRVEQRVRAGKTFGNPPFDELYELGVERDNDLWIRGIVATRDSKKGSGPLGTTYFLSNSDVARRIYSNGLISISAGPLLDLGTMHAPTPDLAPHAWLATAGAEVRATVLGTAVVFSYGRDLRNGSNGFFATTAH